MKGGASVEGELEGRYRTVTTLHVFQNSYLTCK